ncbi:DsRNA-binding protein 5, putative isoform 1 [Hibiscus syriacus]|uniref:DsRNA-binding protein 5, putative isoform 1 n=1 Tax=Hibiscus syriacus TaxID=106335 RepID=A0A6A2ZBB1_HIBSY|nr:DsRNA-binding protein 5, putative isoform 1 [Hibiscus syriacus]
MHYDLLLMMFSMHRNKQASDVKKALENSKISDRQVHVKWWKLGRWFYRFRMRDESHSRCLSLEDLATLKDDADVLGVLHRGAIHEVLQVQISVVNSTSSAWLNQSSQ